MNWLTDGDPVPALLVHPRGAVSLDEAHAAIEQWEHYSRKKLDPGQRLAVEHMMAETEGGRWAARSTGRSVARQNGKGDELEVPEFWGITQRGEWIVHTAHEIPTSKSAHLRLTGLLQHKDFRSKTKVRYANGDQQISVSGDSGGIIVYRTRTSGGGRGLDDISRLVIDEAQHAQPEQLASSTPILAANPNPQLNFAGTSGILEKSDWWWSLRRRALEGDDDGFAWLEHSAERIELDPEGRVLSTKPDPEDRSTWYVANPALGDRIEEAYLAEQLRILGPALFSREHLGVWDPFTGGEGGIIDPQVWRGLIDEESTVASSLSYGLSVAPDASWSAIGSAGRRKDGLIHVDNVEMRPGTGWVVSRVAELYAKRRIPIRVNPAAADGALIKSLTDAKVEVVEVDARSYQQACGAFLMAVNNGELRHIDQQSMNIAVVAAGRRDIGKEGGWVWAHGVRDISPLTAATLALSGVEDNEYDALESVL